MRSLLVSCLLLVAQSAYAADHVWRVWCGDPPTKRAGVYDTSRECWEIATNDMALDECVDTKNGPRFMGKRMSAWDRAGFRTCDEVRKKTGHCSCEPEATPTE